MKLINGGKYKNFYEFLDDIQVTQRSFVNDLIKQRYLAENGMKIGVKDIVTDVFTEYTVDMIDDLIEEILNRKPNSVLKEYELPKAVVDYVEDLGYPLPEIVWKIEPDKTEKYLLSFYTDNFELIITVENNSFDISEYNYETDEDNEESNLSEEEIIVKIIQFFYKANDGS